MLLIIHCCAIFSKTKLLNVILNYFITFDYIDIIQSDFSKSLEVMLYSKL